MCVCLACLLSTILLNYLVLYILVVHYFSLMSSIPNLLISLLVDKYLGYFQSLSIMNKVTVKILYRSLCSHVFISPR